MVSGCICMVGLAVEVFQILRRRCLRDSVEAWLPPGASRDEGDGLRVQWRLLLLLLMARRVATRYSSLREG
jgi:hypothetical protein